MDRTGIAAVVIGRNEGARLDRCFASLGGLRVVYVDSGSSDDSVARARAAGAEVIELDEGLGHSAARGRNAGLDRLSEDPAVAYVQMIDGDCALAPGWITAGAAALNADPGLGAVFGRLREARVEASLYAWLCDVEWSGAGPDAPFAGNVMLRAAAVQATGRYRSEMIAGEDPDFALRMRAAGWRIASLPDAMAEHDADMQRFGQWWRRAVRSGHGFAALSAHHPHAYRRNIARILLWGGMVPAAATAGLFLAGFVDRAWLWLTAAALLLTGAQMIRVALRETARHGRARGFTLALFLMLGKYAEMIGLARYHLVQRWSGSR